MLCSPVQAISNAAGMSYFWNITCTTSTAIKLSSDPIVVNALIKRMIDFGYDGRIIFIFFCFLYAFSYLFHFSGGPFRTIFVRSNPDSNFFKIVIQSGVIEHVLKVFIYIFF